MVTQLELGQKVNASPKNTWLITQRGIRNIVATFAENINEAGDLDEDEEEQILNYLRKLVCFLCKRVPVYQRTEVRLHTG